MAAKKKNSTPSAAKKSQKPADAAARTARKKSAAALRREAVLAFYSVPPSFGRGRLTLAQARKAVATALRGKVFKADV